MHPHDTISINDTEKVDDLYRTTGFTPQLLKGIPLNYKMDVNSLENLFLADTERDSSICFSVNTRILSGGINTQTVSAFVMRKLECHFIDIHPKFPRAEQEIMYSAEKVDLSRHKRFSELYVCYSNNPELTEQLLTDEFIELCSSMFPLSVEVLQYLFVVYEDHREISFDLLEKELGQRRRLFEIFKDTLEKYIAG